MSVAKVKTPNALGRVNFEEENDFLSTFIKQGIGKYPCSSPPRSTDSPVQWIQLPHSFDNQADLPGWPLLTSVKTPMQKCDKCNREFFSPINHRRHTRVHHRLKSLDKDSLKNREILHVFWDKLSADEAKEIVALKTASVEDLPGATVIKALASLIRKPVFPPLPHFYIKSGSALLDIVQARPSRFPIPSQEFFSILDDASEKTFLSGPAVSMQKYLFDGEVRKIGLDAKNLVAFVSFLLEQKLVEAWLADKDAEALRCQKLLMEEEEAAQKRRAELLERKRRRKLRQKELKAKEHRNEEAENRDGFHPMEAKSLSETSAHVNAFDLERQDLDGPSEISQSEMPQLPIEEEADSKAQMEVGFVDKDTSNCESVELQSHRPLGLPSWHVPPKPHAMSNGFYQMKNLSTSKPEFKPRHGIRDLRVAHTVNNKKVWSRKPKPEKGEENLKFRMQEASAGVGQDKKYELLIGSIAVNLGSCDIREKCDYADQPVDGCELEFQSLKKVNNVTERSNKFQSGGNRSTVKLWRRRQGVNDSIPVKREAEVDTNALNVDSQTVNDGACLSSSSLEISFTGSLLFSSEAARTFLSQRWKQALADDHVKLVLSPELDTLSPGTEDCGEVSRYDDGSILGNAENTSHSGVAMTEFKTKPGKVLRKRYIPKQRVRGT